jgi:hypothetical protein
MNDYVTEYKGYQIKPYREVPSCVVIVTAGQGGKIPDILSGVFTTRSTAMKEIDKYLDNKPVKEETNGKARSKSGG